MAQQQSSQKQHVNKISENVQNWNYHFGEAFPLTEELVRNPTEKDFRDIIILSLQAVSINVACFNTIDRENGKVLRALRFRMVSIINQLLRKILTDDNLFQICYMDLVKPTRPCVNKFLSYILSYVGFFNMVEQNINDCYERTQERENLKTQKNHLRKTIEESKIHTEQNLSQIKEIEKKIPHLKSTIGTLIDREERLKKEISTIHKEMKSSDFKLEELRSQIMSINENIVNDEEAESILESREQVQEQLDEQEEIIVAGRQKLKENSATIEKVQSLTMKMDQLITSSNFDIVDLKQMKKHFENLAASINKFKFSLESNSAEIKNLLMAINQKKEKVTKLIHQKNEAEAVYSNLTRANSSVIRQNNAVLKQLESKEDYLHNTKMAIKDELDLLYTIATNVIKQMNESITYE